MKEVPISKLRTKFDQVVSQAQKTKKPIRITYRGKPIGDILLIKPTQIEPGIK